MDHGRRRRLPRALHHPLPQALVVVVVVDAPAPRLALRVVVIQQPPLRVQGEQRRRQRWHGRNHAGQGVPDAERHRQGQRGRWRRRRRPSHGDRRRDARAHPAGVPAAGPAPAAPEPVVVVGGEAHRAVRRADREDTVDAPRRIGVGGGRRRRRGGRRLRGVPTRRRGRGGRHAVDQDDHPRGAVPRPERQRRRGRRRRWRDGQQVEELPAAQAAKVGTSDQEQLLRRRGKRRRTQTYQSTLLASYI